MRFMRQRAAGTSGKLCASGNINLFFGNTVRPAAAGAGRTKDNLPVGSQSAAFNPGPAARAREIYTGQQTTTII